MLISLRMKLAVGTSVLVMTMTSAAALGGRLLTSHPTLDWAVVAPFAGDESGHGSRRAVGKRTPRRTGFLGPTESVGSR